MRKLDFTGYEGVPSHTQHALRQYVENGLAPGGFLTAVLENDLMGAIGRADSQNIAALKEIAQFIYNRVPSVAHGYKGVVDDYLEALWEWKQETGGFESVEVYA